MEQKTRIIIGASVLALLAIVAIIFAFSGGSPRVSKADAASAAKLREEADKTAAAAPPPPSQFQNIPVEMPKGKTAGR